MSTTANTKPKPAPPKPAPFKAKQSPEAAKQRESVKIANAKQSPEAAEQLERETIANAEQMARNITATAEKMKKGQNAAKRILSLKKSRAGSNKRYEKYKKAADRPKFKYMDTNRTAELKAANNAAKAYPHRNNISLARNAELKAGRKAREAERKAREAERIAKLTAANESKKRIGSSSSRKSAKSETIYETYHVNYLKPISYVKKDSEKKKGVLNWLKEKLTKRKSGATRPTRKSATKEGKGPMLVNPDEEALSIAATPHSGNITKKDTSPKQKERLPAIKPVYATTASALGLPSKKPSYKVIHGRNSSSYITPVLPADIALTAPEDPVYATVSIPKLNKAEKVLKQLKSDNVTKFGAYTELKESVVALQEKVTNLEKKVNVTADINSLKSKILTIDAKIELAKAKIELANAKKELAKAKIELANAKKELANAKKDSIKATSAYIAKLDEGDDKKNANKILITLTTNSDKLDVDFETANKELVYAKVEYAIATVELANAKTKQIRADCNSTNNNTEKLACYEQIKDLEGMVKTANKALSKAKNEAGELTATGAEEATGLNTAVAEEAIGLNNTPKKVGTHEPLYTGIEGNITTSVSHNTEQEENPPTPSRRKRFLAFLKKKGMQTRKFVATRIEGMRALAKAAKSNKNLPINRGNANTRTTANKQLQPRAMMLLPSNIAAINQHRVVSPNGVRKIYTESQASNYAKAPSGRQSIVTTESSSSRNLTKNAKETKRSSSGEGSRKLSRTRSVTPNRLSRQATFSIPPPTETPHFSTHSGKSQPKIESQPSNPSASQTTSTKKIKVSGAATPVSPQIADRINAFIKQR